MRRCGRLTEWRRAELTSLPASASPFPSALPAPIPPFLSADPYLLSSLPEAGLVQSVLSAGHAHGARAANQFEAAAQRETATRAALQQAEAAAARERSEGAEKIQRVQAERDEIDALQRRFVKCQTTASAQGE